MTNRVYKISTKSDSNTESLSLNWDEDNKRFIDEQGLYKGQVLLDLPENVDKNLLNKLKNNARYWSTSSERNPEAWISWKEAGLSGRSVDEMKIIFGSPVHKGSDLTVADAFDKVGYSNYLTHIQGKKIFGESTDIAQRGFTFDKPGYKEDYRRRPIADYDVYRALEAFKWSEDQTALMKNSPAVSTAFSDSIDYPNRWDQIMGDQISFNESINQFDSDIDKYSEQMQFETDDFWANVENYPMVHNMLKGAQFTEAYKKRAITDPGAGIDDAAIKDNINNLMMNISMVASTPGQAIDAVSSVANWILPSGTYKDDPSWGGFFTSPDRYSTGIDAVNIMDFTWDERHGQWGNQPYNQARQNRDMAKIKKEKFQMQHIETVKESEFFNKVNGLKGSILGGEAKDMFKDTAIPDLIKVGYSLDELLQMAKDRSPADYAGEIGDID